MEGNRLTIAQMPEVLNGITGGGKPLQDPLESRRPSRCRGWRGRLVLIVRFPHAPGDLGMRWYGAARSPRNRDNIARCPKQVFARWHRMTAHSIVVAAWMQAASMKIPPLVDGHGPSRRRVGQNKQPAHASNVGPVCLNGFYHDHRKFLCPKHRHLTFRGAFSQNVTMC